MSKKGEETSLRTKADVEKKKAAPADKDNKKEEAKRPPVASERKAPPLTDPVVTTSAGKAKTTEATKSPVTTTTVIVKADKEEEVEEKPPSPAVEAAGQQIYIIQTTDGSIPMETAEVVVADDLAVYETVSALEQLSRGNMVTTATTGEGGELIQVYEEVVLPGDAGSGGIIDQFVDVAEVEVGDGRSSSPVKVDSAPARGKGGRKSGAVTASNSHIVSVGGGAAGPEFHICRLCNQFVSLEDIADHNRQHHRALGELTCTDCGKVFKSKRSLFGHKKEKHSGVTEVHHCPECGKSFGRKSNLKAHRESLHYGKKFPCSYCERIFTNRSSMNQHIKKAHTAPEGSSIVVQQE